MQPLLIDLRGKKVVIAGGGKTAARKAAVLEGEQAEIIFIAPAFSKEVKELAQKNGYVLLEREASPSDFTDAMLVILATNDRTANARLASMIPPHKLVCVADQWEKGNVLFPGTVRRGRLILAVSTGGASPKLTRKIKQELAEKFDESWDAYTQFLYECRTFIKKLPLEKREKDEWLKKLAEEEYRMDPRMQQKEVKKLKEKLALFDGTADPKTGC